MSGVLVLLCIVGALVVLDVTAMLFGYDSRDGFRSERRSPYQPRHGTDDASREASDGSRPSMETRGRIRLRRAWPAAMARAACRGLPWLVLLTISVSAAYGMTVSVVGAESVARHDETVSITIDGLVSSGECDVTSAWVLLNAVSNGWIPTGAAGYCKPGQSP